MSEVPVYYDEFEVGRLLVDGEGAVSFQYDGRWQSSARAFPISITMPLERALHPPGIVHPWIANLLPEEAQLAAVARSLGVDRTDTLAILREIGGDTAGALSFEEPSVRSKWQWRKISDHYEIADPSKALRRHFEDLRHRPFMIGEDGIRLSLAGGQQKTTLTVLGPDGRPKLGLPTDHDKLALPMHGAPSTVIIKPDNERLPGIVENEAYCLKLADAIGIRAAEADVIVADNRTALIVARYDRDLRRDGTIRRLHQEDLAQALGVYPSQKYERGTRRGPSLVDILTVGGNEWKTKFQAEVNLQPAERFKLIDQAIYNILVANTDAHAKNYSLLLSGQTRMAPLYDVSCVLPWPEVNQYFAQNIAGKKRKPENIALRHWALIAQEVGFNARQFRNRVEAIIDAIVRYGHDVCKELSTRPGVNAKTVEHVRDSIQSNVLRIAGRL